ncbi:PAS domain-containing protein [Rhizobiaceae bacterium n13]|uniref:histidine kinase n=1 Tax=Ferirhizobium litorale TaxID=2927786 RepID=A0AAE3QBS8_9HYPH|nr:PAS domain-containing protein [Fererhizobium litorale]MDI7865255.1 PAS domain-containing protein [Fererhizobium litorale]MDI7922135.1 PAS domain-containing protein [Fererhizobium litorale]
MQTELGRVLDTLPGMVFSALPDGRIDFVNKDLADFSGVPMTETNTWEWPVHAEPPEESVIVERFRSKLSLGEPFEMDVPTLRADGESRLLRVRCNPMLTDGKVQKWYGLATECDLASGDSRSEHETDFQRIVDSIPVPVAVTTPTGDVEALNNPALEYFGMTLEELKNWKAIEVVHPEDLQHIIADQLEAHSTGTFYNVESRHLRSDGLYRWHNVLGLPFKDRDGNILRWFHLLVDIDDRKRAELALAAREREAQLVLESIPAGIGVLAPDGEVEAINGPLLRYYGRTLEELRDWGNTDVVHPDDMPRMITAVSDAITSGSPYDTEVRLRRADGAHRWFQITGHPLKSEDDNIVRWYALHVDINDRKRAEEALAERERESRFIIDGIAGMIAIFSPDAKLIGGNQQIIDYFQRPIEELDNWATNGITHPDDLQICIDSFMGAIATGEPYDYETRFLRHDGTWRWFQLRGLPLRNTDGQIVRWYGLLTDIDDRKRTEESLRRSEAFLADAQRLSKTGSFSLKLGTDEVTWSAETYRIFDVDPSAKVTLRTILSRLDHDSFGRVQRVLQRAREGNGDFDYDITLVMPDKSMKHVRVLAHSERNKDGEQELTGAVQDVTESRRAEETLNEVRSELAYVTRVTSLGVLTASIAHEVNQPLAGIVTNASTCLRVLTAEPPNMEVAKDTARRMIRDANRAAEVIVRLRALFSRKPPTIEPIDMNEIASEVIALALSDLQRARVSVATDFGHSLPRVAGARVQLQQVIMNLLRNAIEALAGINDRPKQIVIKTQADPTGEVQISVSDDGVGFGSQEMGRIFDAFYTTKPDGMGIGLSVSRSIVESHNGRLWAKANNNHGATVAFAIPIYEVARESCDVEVRDRSDSISGTVR